MSLALPVSFQTRMQTQLGEAYPAFADALAQPSPTSIRVNKAKLALPTSLQPVPWTETGFYLSARPSFTLDPLFHGGAYYVQEASSMFLEQALRQSVDLDQPLAVLDLCGAPGGKSTHIASLLSPESLLVANEVIKPRANILAENIQKWGSGNVVVTNNDPSHIGQLTSFFDVLVVDAPCSGEGMFRKDPDAVNEWSEANVKLCSERQRRILMDVWDALKPGGVLIYSTCTYNREENEENLAWLARQQDAETITLQLQPEWGITETELEGMHGYRFYPHRTQGEGFFLAAVRKTDGEEARTFKKSKRPYLVSASKQEKALVQDWLKEPKAWEFVKHKETLRALPAAWMLELEQLYENLRVVYGGIEVAEVMKNNAKPLPALALSQYVSEDAFPSAEVDFPTALRYLHREDIALEDSANGWVLVQFQGVALGWGKKLQNRVNNHYPKEWRIRMSLDEALKPENVAALFTLGDQ
ncbi:methyltransferase RsmF C-terminal domain-like protein [Rufibacter tibetensis]|uniref:rRNA methyltransferase n=1 Tax=Rufibacter tibetensis TaxID=512763 RepID=A0A0P0C2X4_9BACT|nr:rRNA methyltransferase [Rufibacter tibetensis]ALI99061.1 rRNA methyltransferase [Rufibacter tibetensis]